MTISVKTDLTDKEVSLLKIIAKEENLDLPVLTRKFILQQIKQYQVQKMAQYYRKSLVSLAEAATQAEVSLYEMMDYLQQEQIRPPHETDPEIEDEIKESIKIFDETGE